MFYHHPPPSPTKIQNFFLLRGPRMASRWEPERTLTVVPSLSMGARSRVRAISVEHQREEKGLHYSSCPRRLLGSHLLSFTGWLGFSISMEWELGEPNLLQLLIMVGVFIFSRSVGGMASPLHFFFFVVFFKNTITPAPSVWGFVCISCSLGLRRLKRLI